MAGELEGRVAELEATETKLAEKTKELEKVGQDVTATEEAKTKAKADLEALKAEQDRVKADIAKAKSERRSEDSNFQQKLRGENLEAAKEKVLSEFGITEPAAQSQLLEEFKKFDTGAVNAELIARDMRKAYASLHADELLETQRRVKVLSEGSDSLREALSSTSFSGSGLGVREESTDLSPEDIQAARNIGMPLERYKQLKKEGKI